MLIAVCDDEPFELDAINKSLSCAASELSAALEIAAYSSGQQLLDAVDDGLRPELVILDIYMEGLDGVETARRLREHFPFLPVAFLTTSRDHAIDAFELDAIHYLLKPVTQEKARALLERFPARKMGSASSGVLALTCGREVHRFLLESIRYISSQDRGTVLHLETQKRGQWLACPFCQVAEHLIGEPDFLQISRGCVVNLNAVLCIGREECRMKNGESLSISRRERSKVQKSYHEFLFRRLNKSKEVIL